jgi:hypothetical protein
LRALPADAALRWRVRCPAAAQFCVSPPKTDIENSVVVSDYAQMDRILKDERCARARRRDTPPQRAAACNPNRPAALTAAMPAPARVRTPHTEPRR